MPRCCAAGGSRSMLALSPHWRTSSPRSWPLSPRSWGSIVLRLRLNEKAIGYWLKAGQQAIARRAMTEAVAQLRKGLDLLSSVLDGVARHELELDLPITLAQALMAAKGLAALG